MIEVEIEKSVYLECYHYILDPLEGSQKNDVDIELLWGCRDSGKSKFVAQYLTEQSMFLDYFRCLLIKETHESIKDAQWLMIKDVVESDWLVDSLFKFQSSPLSIKLPTAIPSRPVVWTIPVRSGLWPILPMLG